MIRDIFLSLIKKISIGKNTCSGTGLKAVAKVLVIENLHSVPFGFKEGKSSAWASFDLQSTWESCKDRKETII